MSKIVTLRMDETLYRRFLSLAKKDNRPLSNFIETAALRYVETGDMAGDAEMEGIWADKKLQAGIKRGLKDAKAGRGRFV